MELGGPYRNDEGQEVDEESVRVETKNGQRKQRERPPTRCADHLKGNSTNWITTAQDRRT